MSRKIRATIVGATGYAGAELVRLLSTHPQVEIAAVTSSRSAGIALREECPWLATDLVLTSFEPEKVDPDVVFLAQEAGFAMEHAATLLSQARVIDLSADFRLKDALTYEAYYGRAQTDSKSLGHAVYGLPELGNREAIAKATLIANPGCYPTASLLGLMPLVNAGLVDGVPVIDAKSGVSGAGRARKETDYLFSELNGGMKAYGVTGHRHSPEIEQLAGRRVRFTPHLIPVARGLQAAIHVPISKTTDLFELYREAYRDEPFVVVQKAQPSTKQVIGSNTCAICPSYDAHTGFAVVTSVIDNLVKGAAGQAVQNMNLMFDFPETTGLSGSGVWP